MKLGIIGSGSWATALSKVLTDNGYEINWLFHDRENMEYFRKKKHNPHYLSSTFFDCSAIRLSCDIREIVSDSEVLVVAIPSAYVSEALSPLDSTSLKNKTVVSAVKGLIPGKNQLLGEFLSDRFNFDPLHYVTLLGPSHAEEIAADKLSYLTFSGMENQLTAYIAGLFKNDYIRITTNDDVKGVQYASILKNVYALGAGIAHGLEYGDNFLSVYIASCASEMACFLEKLSGQENQTSASCLKKYLASVYLGDLLVTCYSPYSRNRTFGNMIGKGYTVQAATLEQNMVAEGYAASKSFFEINRDFVGASMPLEKVIYRILWAQLPAREAFEEIEAMLV